MKKGSAWFITAAALPLHCSLTFAQPTVCARVGIELSQEAVVSRNAFRATLTINNGGTDTLSGVGVVLQMLDPNGIDGTDHFSGVDSPTILGDLTGVDGAGILPPSSSGSAQWILIPFDTAAPNQPVIYGFGGTLSYTTSQGEVNIPLEPVYLSVLPNPKLRARYFWERDVYADDPLTLDQQEPIQPFSVALMLSNIGAGVANNVRFASAQPVITRNDRRLLIDFQLTGSQVDCQPITPSLQFSLGDLPPSTTKTARWLMTSTLSGHFEDLRVRMEHIDGLGDPRLSLFEEPLEQPHELIHAVRDQAALADCAPDYLVSDLSPFTTPPDAFEDPADPERLHLPDRIYLSNGEFEPVVPVFGATATVQSQLRATINATVPPTGWFYIKLPDPSEANYQLVSLTRSDGKQIEIGTNAWQTNRVFRDNSEVPLRLNRLHIFDTGGAGQYTAVYENLGGTPAITNWEVVATHGTPAVDVVTQMLGDNEYSESRDDAISVVRARFSRPIKAESLSASSISLAAKDLAGNPLPLSDLSWTRSLSFDQRELTLTFNRALTDRARYCLTLTGITDPFNNVFAQNTRITFTVLEGDAFGDRRTNNSDAGAVRSVLGRTFDPTNPLLVRADLNRDGQLNQSDLDLALSLRGIDARGIASPCPGGNPPPTGPGDLAGGPNATPLDGIVPEPMPGGSPSSIDDVGAIPARAATPLLLQQPRLSVRGLLSVLNVVADSIGPEPLVALKTLMRGAHATALALHPTASSAGAVKYVQDGSVLLWSNEAECFVMLADSAEFEDARVAASAKLGFVSPIIRDPRAGWGVVRPVLRFWASDQSLWKTVTADLPIVLESAAGGSEGCCILTATLGTAETLVLAAERLAATRAVEAVELDVVWINPIHLLADFNADGKIDDADFEAFAATYSVAGVRADLTQDGIVSDADLLAFFGAWQE